MAACSASTQVRLAWCWDTMCPESSGMLYTTLPCSTHTHALLFLPHPLNVRFLHSKLQNTPVYHKRLKMYLYKLMPMQTHTSHFQVTPTWPELVTRVLKLFDVASTSDNASQIKGCCSQDNMDSSVCSFQELKGNVGSEMLKSSCKRVPREQPQPGWTYF